MIVSLVACAPAGTSSDVGSTASSTVGTSSTGTASTVTSSANGDDDLYYNKTGFPICDKTIQVVASGPLIDANHPFGETIIHQWWIDQYGIEVDWQMYMSDMWQAQLVTMVSSDELPDMLINARLAMSQAHEYGDDGFFANWNDYKELAPNTFGRFEEFPDWELYLTSPKGGIYGMGPYSGWPHEIHNRVYMRQDWLDNLKLEVPETLDDLYNVLKAFKEQDANNNGDPNDEIPLVLFGENYIYGMLLEAFGIYVENSNWNLPLVINDEGKVECALNSDAYKAFIEYVKKLYTDGLIDQTGFADTNDEKKAKGAKMIVGMHGEVPFSFRSTLIGADADSVAIGGITSEWSNVKAVSQQYGITDLNMQHIVCANSEYKEALIRLLDYYNGDPEGAGKGYEEANAGPWGETYTEGVSWTYATDPVTGYNVRYMFWQEADVDHDIFNNENIFRSRKATITGLNMFSTIDFIGRGTLYRVDDEKLLSKESLDVYGWAALSEALMRREDVTLIGPTDRFPLMAYNDEEAKTRADRGTDVRNLVNTKFVQFVTGQVEFDWDAFQTELKNAGLEQLIAAEQSAYDRYSANM